MSAPATASPLAINFDAATHTYRVAGQVWPSVTQVLSVAGFSDYSDVPRDTLEYAQRRGTFVHRACWYDDMGVLEPSTLDPAIAGYVEAWRSFRRNTGFTPDTIEQMLACPIYRYCGQYDREGHYPDDSRSIPDLKTGAYSPAWRYQLAGYSRLHPNPLRRKREAVKLNDDGTYKLYEFPISEYREDESVFLSCVNLWWAKAKHRLLPN